MAHQEADIRFEGLVGIVTGASLDPSIGRATATRLAREGAAIVINGRNAEPLHEAERALREAGFSVASVVGSTEDEQTARRLVAAAHDEFGRLDFVVNTVGGNRFLGSPREMEREELMGTIELNTWSALALVQAAIEGGLADGGGAVVNVSSGTVHKTTPKMIAYAAAKSALNAITKTLARDLAPLGVRVNAVAPGLTRTSGTREIWEPDNGRAAAQNLLLGRITEAEDIANACAFLLSNDARQITGQILDVDAGNHLMGGGWTPMTDETIQGRIR
ncbi:MAG: SDR family oxidoreductase [bacterium]|nr:SDR family oxidoreductase [bacterium]